jgi:hypothetical protein
LARQLSDFAAAATHRATPARALATAVPGSRPMRQSTAHQAGVELARSPPRMMPGLNFSALSMPPYQRSHAQHGGGDGAAGIDIQSAEHAARIRQREALGVHRDVADELTAREWCRQCRAPAAPSPAPSGRVLPARLEGLQHPLHDHVSLLGDAASLGLPFCRKRHFQPFPIS